MTKPLISVIVPVYNVEDYIVKCIGTLLAQTYKNIEIILVNDGSTDHSAAICDYYSNKYEHVKTIHQINSGVSAARNAGIKIARGEYIGFVDGDDWIEPNMYEILHEVLVEETADIAVIAYERDGIRREHQGKAAVGCYSSEQAIYELFNNSNIGGYVWSKLFAARLFNDISFNTEISMCEDLYACLELFIKAKKVAYCTYIGYHYVQRTESATHDFSCSFFSFKKSIQTIKALAYQYDKNIRTMINVNIVKNFFSLAMVMGTSRQLNEDVYQEVIHEIDETLSKGIYKELPIKLKYWVMILRCDRNLFIIICRIVNGINSWKTTVLKCGLHKYNKEGNDATIENSKETGFNSYKN